VGTRCADHVTPLYPHKLALTSPTGGGRSVGIVRVRTKATEFLVYWILGKHCAPPGYGCPSDTRTTLKLGCSGSLLLTLADPLYGVHSPKTLNIDKHWRTFLWKHIYFLLYANMVMR